MMEKNEEHKTESRNSKGLLSETGKFFNGVMICHANGDEEGKYIQNNIFYNIHSSKYLKKAFVILVILVMASLYIYASVRCANYVETANYEKQNNNFLRAAENYHHASVIAKSLIFMNKRHQEYICIEADCYLMQGVNEEDEDIAKKYYFRAANIYSQIVDKKNAGTNFYLDALAGLSYVYKFSGHAVDKEWSSLISQIKKEAKKLDKWTQNARKNNDENMDSLYRWLRIYQALGDYYYELIQTDYSCMYNANIVNSALIYYEKYYELFEFVRKGDKNLVTQMDSVYPENICSELLIFIARSPMISNPKQYAAKAIEICQSTLENASMKKIKPESYIELKSHIAAGYRVLAKEEKDEYMKKAYDELQPLLDMKSEKVPMKLIIDVGYSAIFTGFCTDEDIEKILENYQELLLQYNVREEPKETARIALNVCDACKQIIQYYGCSKKAWEMGKDITEEVKDIDEYVQKSQKRKFDEFYEYFHQKNKKSWRNPDSTK